MIVPLIRNVYSAFSSLKSRNRSVRYGSPSLWNKLPSSFCQPSPDHSSSHSVHCTHASMSPCTCTIHHSFSLSFQDQNLFFHPNILYTIDFLLSSGLPSRTFWLRTYTYLAGIQSDFECTSKSLILYRMLSIRQQHTSV